MRHHPSLPEALALVVALALPMLPAAAQEAQQELAPKEKQPKAMLVEPIADLGAVTYEDTRTHEFVIRNTGEGVLRIHAVNSTCACMVVDFPSEIAPGGEGRITARFEAQLQQGPVAVPIVAVTNDPDSPQLMFTIKADVRYFIQALPGFARYLVVQDFDADSTLVQTLWSIDGKPMKITGVETPYDFITATFREARPEEMLPEAKGAQQWKVETKISPKAPVGALTGFITVHIDHPMQKVVKLPLHGFVRPMFAVTPPEADWGALKMGDEGYETSLLVKNFAEEKVKVTGADATVAGITAQVEEVDPGRVYFVKLSYAPDLPKGKFNGVLRIRTESPKKPTIEVPLKGTIL